MLQHSLLVLCRLCNPPYHHRYCPDYFTNAGHPKDPDEPSKESFSECHLWLGRLVRLVWTSPFFFTKALSSSSRRESIADSCLGHSVTIVAFVRLVFPVDCGTWKRRYLKNAEWRDVRTRKRPGYTFPCNGGVGSFPRRPDCPLSRMRCVLI